MYLFRQVDWKWGGITSGWAEIERWGRGHLEGVGWLWCGCVGASVEPKFLLSDFQGKELLAVKASCLCVCFSCFNPRGGRERGWAVSADFGEGGRAGPRMASVLLLRGLQDPEGSAGKGSLSKAACV